MIIIRFIFQLKILVQFYKRKNFLSMDIPLLFFRDRLSTESVFQLEFSVFVLAIDDHYVPK